MSQTRYDAQPRFRRGQIFKTPAGSEIALERIHTHPTDADYVDSVEFKVKSIEYVDVVGPRAFFYERPRVGDKIKIYNQDLGAIGWPRVRYQPTINAASRVASKYKNKKQVDKADGSGKTTVYEYSKGQVDHRNREKAKRIEKLKRQISSLRTKVKSDLKSVDPKTKLTALAVALMDETCERVGNDESVKERGHFGITTLQAKHVKINGSTATLSYKGKSGVSHKKTVSDAAVVKALKEALEGKSGSDTILCEGDDCNVRASDVNDYLKEYDITAKDIRGFRANDEMVRQLEKHRKGKLPEDKKEREDKLKEEFEKALEATAEVVGHEPSTLKNQYLVPKMEDQYKDDGTVMKKWDKTAKNVPTNPALWDKVISLTKGDTKSISHNGETVEGPNNGTGFQKYPTAYANGWASKVYGDLGGGWKEEEEETKDKKAFDETEHPCMSGGDCQCGGNCGCAKKRLEEQNKPFRHTYKTAAGDHTLPKLPYAYDALEPWLSEETLKLHHDKHHKGYVDGLNSAEEMLKAAKEKDDYHMIRQINEDIAFHWGGHYLHTVYWECLGKGVEASDSLKAEINESFGSWKSFREQFQKTAESVQGSGWAVLTWNKSLGMQIAGVKNHEHRVLWNSNVIFPFDVWEHAYYVDHRNDRTSHFESVFDNCVNWSEIEKRLQHAKQPQRLASVQTIADRFARGKAKKDVGHGGLDEWFSGHGGAKGKGENATWGDWVSISPVTKTLPSGKKVEKGDIVGDCGISSDPDWKEETKGGKNPLKCMPRSKAYGIPKKERAEKAKAKQKAEKSTPNTKKPTHTPTFDKKKKKAALKPEDVHHLADKLNIPWDNDPDFLEWTKSVTGKKHLDDLNQNELKSVMTALNEKKAFLQFTVTPAEMDLEADLALFDELVDEMRSEGWVRLSHVITQEDPTYRVASRWLTANQQAFDNFQTAIESIQRMQRSDNFIPYPQGSFRLRELNQAWISLVQDGMKVCNRLMEERVIPKRLNKGFEMAYRIFSTARKFPAYTRRRGFDPVKFGAWWKKTEKRCELVVRGWNEWDEKSAGGESLFDLGSFTVHNIIGASGDDLEGFKTSLERAERLIRSNSNTVPGFNKVLYGEVFFVPQLTKGHTIAWYDITKDKVYVRKNKAKWGADEVHSIIHELSHRYYRKFADDDAKGNWNAHHWRVGRRTPEVPDLVVGDPLPIRVKGAPRGWRPKVWKVERGMYIYMMPGAEKIFETHANTDWVDPEEAKAFLDEHMSRLVGSIPIFEMNQFRGKTDNNLTVYPTVYSSTNAEEHFCDALALNCMGSLDPIHSVPFKDIWVQGGDGKVEPKKKKFELSQGMPSSQDLEQGLQGLSKLFKSRKSSIDRILERHSKT